MAETVQPQEIIPADPVPTNPEPASPPPPERSSAGLGEYDGETLRLLSQATNEIESLEADWTTKNAEAKKAKQALDAAHERLPKLIRERANARGKPVQRTLFDQLPTPIVVHLDPLPDGPAEDALEHLWRDFPTLRLTNWGATDSDVAKLAEGVRKRDSPFPLNTMGALADYTANVNGTPGYERRLTDYKGIGTAAATRVDESLAGFWAWYNQRGGREEFARERGLLTPTEVPANATQPEAAGTGDGLDHVERVGEPDAAGVDPTMLDGPSPDEPDEPEELATIPEGAGEEYPLAPDEAEGE